MLHVIIMILSAPLITSTCTQQDFPVLLNKDTCFGLQATVLPRIVDQNTDAVDNSFPNKTIRQCGAYPHLFPLNAGSESNNKDTMHKYVTLEGEIS